MGRPRSKGRSIKAFRAVEEEEDSEAIQGVRDDDKLKALKDDDLFFIDTTGNSQGKSAQKKRKKAAAAEKTAKKPKLEEVADLDNAVDELAALLDTTAKEETAADGGTEEGGEKAAEEEEAEVNTEMVAVEFSGGGVVAGRKKKTRRKSKANKLQKRKIKGQDKPRGYGVGVESKTKVSKAFDVWAADPDEIRLRKESVVQGFETDTTPYLNRMKNRKALHIESSKTHLGPQSLAVSHPGTSVNPTNEDHQAALQEAFDYNTKDRAEKAAIFNALSPQPLTGPLAQAPPDQDDESEIVPKKKKKRLSKSDRNRQQRARLATQKREQDKKDKKLLTQLARADVITKEVIKEEKANMKKKEEIAVLKATQPDRRPRLGKHQYHEEFPTVPLSDELTGSLRTVKTSHNVLRDQFKSFQNKNMIPATVKQKNRKQQGNYKYVLRKAFKTDDLAERDERSREESKHQKYSRKRVGGKKRH